MKPLTYRVKPYAKLVHLGRAIVNRILCYGDSNTYGTAAKAHPDEWLRLDESHRWPGVLAAALGRDWTVIEEGLPGRTTVHNDPINGSHWNGRTYLLPCLESHWPLDAVALMLGTNDLKARFSLPAEDIALGVGSLLQLIRTAVRPGADPPRILLICPPPIDCVGWMGPIFAGGDEKSRRLAPLYRAQAERFGAEFFDAGTVARPSPRDGVHLEPQGHQAIGRSVAREIARSAA